MDSARDNHYLRNTSFLDPALIPGWKRALDIVLILAFPLLLPAGADHRRVDSDVSPGPVLFQQERVGYRGSRFMCYKFRTMVVNADATVHQGHLNN